MNSVESAKDIPTFIDFFKAIFGLSLFYYPKLEHTHSKKNMSTIGYSSNVPHSPLN